MHLTLKKEATKPICGNLLKQQVRFDRFVQIYSADRPHQALDMNTQARCTCAPRLLAGAYRISNIPSTFRNEGGQ
jgi:hypothetical protein